jgi:hypothetical protein
MLQPGIGLSKLCFYSFSLRNSVCPPCKRRFSQIFLIGVNLRHLRIIFLGFLIRVHL